MTVSFAVLNAKGGVGKTTTAVNIAAMAATLPRPDGKPRRVLICDLDAQMNATHQLGFPDLEVHETLAGTVTREADLEPIIIQEAATIPGLDLLPSHYQLSYIDEAVLMTGTWLRRKLKPLRSRYDLIIFDCPVHLGPLTRNALGASDGLLIPTQAEKHSVTGLPHLIARARQTFEETECSQPWAYIIVTMFDARNSIERNWAQQVRKEYEGVVLKTAVRRNTDLSKSATGGLPVVVYDEKCTGYADYREATIELLDLIESTTPSLRVVKSDETAAG
ncbi:MAG: ParA family protein [Candidatus Binatia bacterium]